MSFMEESSTIETSFVTRRDAETSDITKSQRTRSTRKKHRKLPEPEMFSYDPLPKQRGAIRLLKLVPSKSTDPNVDCELITPTKEEREIYGYEALSCCWDNEQKTRYVNIRQRGCIYAKYVSPDLHSALKALRHTVDCRFLWIDAICINQEDLDEKNHQVELMHDIYGNADRVCVWLGEQSESSRLALRFIKEEVLQLANFELFPCQHAIVNWLALVELMQRPWFSRRCAVQEITLAQTAVLYCGPDRIPWRHFAIAVGIITNVESTTHWLSKALKKSTRYDPSWSDSISSLGASLLVDAIERLSNGWSYSTEEDERSDSEESSSSESVSEVSSSVQKANLRTAKIKLQPLLSLEYLVSTFTTFESTVPHDTIYALLAIAKDTAPQAASMDTLQPLYHSLPGSELSVSQVRYNVDYKTPYVDVCKEFIQFCIKNTPQSDRCRALDIICRPWAIEEKKLAERRKGKQKAMDEVVKLHNEEGNQSAKDKPQNATASSINNELAVSFTAGISERVDIPLPSWVPQLDKAPFGVYQHAGLVRPSMNRKNADPLASHPSPAQCKYSAAATTKIDMKALKFRKRSGITPPHYSMYTRGFHLDTIHDVTHVARNGEIPKEWMRFGGWPTAKGSPPGALWRTLVADRERDARRPPLYYSRALEGIFATEEVIANGIFRTSYFIQHDNSPVIHEFCERVQAVTWNQALVRTERKTLGLVNQHVERGDIICIMYGCSVPVILRQSARKSDDALAEEIQWELKLAAKTIVRCFKVYNERKKQHQLRKNTETVKIYSKWLGESSRLHRPASGIEVLQQTKATLEAALQAKLQNALLSFRSWYHEWSVVNRRREWRDVTWRRMIAEAAKERKYELAKRTRENWIRLAVMGKKNETASEYDNDNAIDSDEYSDELARELERQRPKGSRPPFDWRQFEIELKFGRRWMNIVRGARARILSEALRHRDSVRQERTLARQSEEPTQQVNAGTELNWDPTPGAFRTHYPSNVDLLTVDVEASSNQLLPQNATHPISRNYRLTLIPQPSLTSRQRRRLTKAQREDYDWTIFHNLREKLGDEGYYSYTLLGECYIHGMMNGEAIQYQHERDIPSKTFEIR